MTDVFFDEQDVSQRLNRVIEENQAQRSAHMADVPAFSPAAAGRDFAGQGARIQAMLERLHSRGVWRLDNITATAEAARAQIKEFSALDEANAASLTHVEPSFGGGVR
ncbi:hypothetical protein HMPREF3155_01030 [Corynebacterium sp. HMSC06D04]|uniref:Uncharacterized protein n=1 Tax=Corynebacterium simulans TaxID=146827 RepID=A0ABR5VB93_9CORY|nr:MULTISPECIES: hypothetical protein [Corynebacterium]KXU18904.1 hypothetical protein WM41_0437 [Corynebacterium simulans]OFM00486.1 hypothetical protein HMPREF2724_08655 [Corynebacterium sp. HMSC071F07]OFR40736.1 hypothetical protein HMPREF2888_05710 [Corynebacterium sp. HMSC077D03]OFT53233.1 hypothetical protein HMPREF3155_01030 [Corynebacterium sp. HMSC06D04]OHO67668.1 hypothetical protein HMPREF2692_05635 [Corynebacterium sp. HMSC036D03]